MGPAHPFYCSRNRVYVTPDARAAMVEAAREMARRFPGTRLIFMDASGPDGIVPFEPHLSHGDGRQVDVSLFYTALDGRPIQGSPPGSRRNGYGNYEHPAPATPNRVAALTVRTTTRTRLRIGPGGWMMRVAAP